LLLVAWPARASEELVLGVLEEVQQCDGSGERVVAVRPVFAKSGDEWRPLPEESGLEPAVEDVPWTVGYDGRRLGTVRTTGSEPTSEDSDYREGILLPAPGQRLPEVAGSGRPFEGWCSTPSRRPLALSSRPNVRDPDRWKPFRAPVELRDRLFQAFRAEAGDASCGDGWGNVVEVPYHADDLKISSAYQDRRGRKLVALVLPYEERCDGPWEGPWRARWFLIGADGARYIGTNLTFVDAGDYDADGSSEILFWYSGYDEDGYTLLHDGLAKRTDAHWHYL